MTTRPARRALTEDSLPRIAHGQPIPQAGDPIGNGVDWVAPTMTIDEIYEAIRALPVADRLRLVERVVSDVAAAADAAGSVDTELLGLFADDPDLIDRVCDDAYRARQQRPWRTPK